MYLSNQIGRSQFVIRQHTVQITSNFYPIISGRLVPPSLPMSHSPTLFCRNLSTPGSSAMIRHATPKSGSLARVLSGNILTVCRGDPLAVKAR